MRPKAVVFDIGNVLIEWNPERFYDATIGEPRRRALFAEVDLHRMNELIDEGALFRETIYSWADQNPVWSAEIRLWHDRWIDIAAPRIEGSIALMRALQTKGIPVFALTNFGAESYAYARTQFEFLDAFDHAYVSGEMSMIKPDPRIYAMVEAHSGIAPEQLLFTDDRAENIAAAAARGWQVHQFTGWQGWAKALVSAGLLSTNEAGL